jgi:hypothetical protein
LIEDAPRDRHEANHGSQQAQNHQDDGHVISSSLWPRA